MSTVLNFELVFATYFLFLFRFWLIVIVVVAKWLAGLVQ